MKAEEKDEGGRMKDVLALLSSSFRLHPLSIETACGIISQIK
jgi:hypothetical protein